KHAVQEETVYEAEAKEVSSVPRSPWVIAALVLVGLGLLIAGSQVFLKGAVGIATQYGVSESVIGLTLVAVGTSLPELSISVLAAIRRHADVAIGNILGSNVFNLLGILGVSALLQPLPVAQRVLDFDQWVLLGSALVLMGFLLSGRRISRLEGALLLAGYAAYAWIGLAAFAG
ncbi:MAG: sodium:calcium antiporter, partial [Thermoplasmatota archaeon]